MKDIPSTSLEALSDCYDVFFVDQFGVLRDDVGAYAGAVAALHFLKAHGKKIVILSNSGRSGEFNAGRLAKLGFDRSSFDFFVTSGDVAYDILSKPNASVTLGGRCLTISSGGDTDLASRLGLTSTSDAGMADLVIISGSEAERIPMARYQEILVPAAERNLPCYCTNPDFHKLANGTLAPGAGSIAQLYEGLGGRVTWLGKPYIEIYRLAQLIAGVDDIKRVVCIGDSIEHDIAGATVASMDSALVRTGINSHVSDENLMTMMQDAGAMPKFILNRFAVLPGRSR